MHQDLSQKHTLRRQIKYSYNAEQLGYQEYCWSPGQRKELWTSRSAICPHSPISELEPQAYWVQWPAWGSTTTEEPKIPEYMRRMTVSKFQHNWQFGPQKSVVRGYPVHYRMVSSSIFDLYPLEASSIPSQQLWQRKLSPDRMSPGERTHLQLRTTVLI